MANFNAVIEKTLYFEGGLSNDPDDPGGLTKYGISKRAYPEIDIEALTVEQAKELYRRDYWLKIAGDRFPGRFERVATTVFDFAVTSGVSKSAKTLQEAINVVKPFDYNPIAVDGIIGMRTLSRMLQCEPIALFAYFSFLRAKYYRLLARDATRRKFLYSWIRRVVDV
jgi:lysozyme family protein